MAKYATTSFTKLKNANFAGRRGDSHYMRRGLASLSASSSHATLRKLFLSWPVAGNTTQPTGV